MSIEPLAASLRQEGHRQATQILDRAREEAAEIAHALRHAATQDREEHLNARRAELSRQHAIALAQKRREVAQRVLATRARFLESVKDRVRARLPEMLTDTRYHDTIPDRIREALSYVGDKAATIHCPEALADLMTQLVSDHQHIAVRASPSAPPGITITVDDGVLTIDDTLHNLLERMMPQLSIDILKQLEPCHDTALG